MLTGQAIKIHGDLLPALSLTLGAELSSWSSKRQPTVALSTCEAEYMGQTQATKEAVWLNE